VPVTGRVKTKHETRHGGHEPAGHWQRMKGETMGRIIKAIVVLVVLGFIGLTSYAFLGDLAPVQGEVVKPVVLNAGN
jgi:hypothetical protein